MNVKSCAAFMGAFFASLMFAHGAARADEAVSFDEGGLQYKSKGGDVELTLGGRLHLDAGSVDQGAGSSGEEEVRRARLELGGKLYDHFRFRIDYEFARNEGWRNAWLGWDFNDAFSIRAGNFTAPFSMEDMSSSNDLMFLERSLSSALAPSFGLGAGASYSTDTWAIAGGYFDEAIDQDDDIGITQGKGFAGRLVWSPSVENDNVIHLGVGAQYRDFDATDVRTISARPGSTLADTVVRTGSITNIDNAMSYNLEGAWSAGPVLIEGQWLTTNLNRNAGGDLSFDGYYAQIGWVITGERHRYSKGAHVFGGVRPNHDWGAVEIAARVDGLDLSEAVANGGDAKDWTAGVNWYLGRNVRLSADYVHSEVDGNTPVLDRDVDVTQARAQFYF